MKKILILTMLFLGGCARIDPFSPDNRQNIDNHGGKIDDIKTNQNGIMAELGNVKEKLDIQNSKLRDIQEGVANFKFGGDNNNANGVQILSGDGALIIIFSLSVIGMLLFYFYKEKKVNKILADAIKKRDDNQLHEEVVRAASYTNVESKIYNLLYK